MAWDRTLPPDDRSLNSPDPPADHNETVKALAEVRTKLGDLPDASAGSLFRWDGSKLVEVAGSATGEALVWDGSQWVADSGTYAKAAPPSVRLGLTANESIATSTSTYVPWDEALWDTTGGNMWSSGDPTLLKITEDGIYLVVAAAMWAQNNTGERSLDIRGPGTDFEAGSRKVAQRWSEDTLSILFDAVAGDDFRFRVRQESGGSLDLLADRRTFFAAMKVGET